MPTDPVIHQEWLSKIITDADNHPSTNIHPVLGEFKHLIESDSTVNSLFGSVFQDLPFKRFSSDIVGLLPKTSPTPIRDYKHFLQVLNRLLTTAPTWVEAPNRVGVVGMPLTAILDWPLNASSGLSLFKIPAVAQILKKVLDAWGEFLKSPQSATVLDNSPTGWFGATGLKALTDAANVGGTNYAFDQVYQCDSSKKHYGFRSWDDFFTRSFREGMRPVAEPDNGNVIVSPCEAKPYKITHGVDNNDKFDVKGSQQSISKMLDDEHLAQQFVGGTVYQAYLGVLDYHHWHAPVSGRVVKNHVIEGAQGPPSSDSFISNIPGSNLWGSAVSEPAAADFTATATRGVVTIDTGDPAIGHVGVVFVGMADISSVEFCVDEGQHVSKGSELGMFHYGGSNHCLVFQKGVNLSWQVNPAPETPIPINQHLAVVSRLQ